MTLLDQIEAPVGLMDIEMGDALPWLPPPPLPSSPETVLVLVRLHTYPIGTVTLHLGPDGLSPCEIAEAINSRLGHEITGHLQRDSVGDQPDGAPFRCLRRRAEVLSTAPPVTIVVATRDRTASLERCLDSLLMLDYPRFDIVVVDNAPTRDTTAELINSRYGERGVRYVRESRRGLAAAHNCGVEAATGDILAFTDDDVVVDRYWLAAIAEAFAMTPNVGAVTGLIQPGELRTGTQLLLERHGAFAKGFDVRVFDLGEYHPGDWRFPLAAGQLGSGANMAFDARCLRHLGGFEPALGTGTVARGGDDLAAFFQVITSGYRLVYQPAALVRHWDQDSGTALVKQAFGYGVGLGAYLTDALARQPGALLRTAWRAPHTWRRPPGRAVGASRGPDSDWPPALARLGHRGMVVGPIAYAASRWQARGARRPG